MKLSAILLGLLIILGCSMNKPYRQPQSVSFLRETEDWHYKLSHRNLNSNECAGELGALRTQINELRLIQMDDSEVKRDGAKILENLWQIRLRLHDQLPDLLTCRQDLILTFQQLRSTEDLLGDKYYGHKPMNPKQIDYSRIPVPFRDNDYYHGYRIRPSHADKRLEFASGDILLTRGVSFFSASLARIPNATGQFSHFVLLHKGNDGKVSSIESYAQTGGVALYSEAEALKNENSRILVLRARDSRLAERAAELMMNEVSSRKIPYDFEMDINDDKKMICSEVAYHAYRKASQGKFLLPESRSELSKNLLPFVKKIGMRPDNLLSPRDMEVDSRFEMIAEFTDYRVLRDLRYRDAIISKIYDWMEHQNYVLQHDNATYLAEHLIWPLRKTPLFPMIQKLGKIPDIPEGTPKRFYITLAQMNNSSEIYYQQLQQLDEEHQQKTGWPMTMGQLDEALEKIRQQELKK